MKSHVHMKKVKRWYCSGCGTIAATLVGVPQHRCPSCDDWMQVSVGPNGVRAWVARKLIWILVRFNHELPRARRPILEGEILQMVHTATWQQKKKKRVKLLDEGLNKLRKGGVNSSPPVDAQPPPPPPPQQHK